MYNKYVEVYCDLYNLRIETPVCKFYGEKVLTENGKIVAVFRDTENIISFIESRQKCKKSDLIHFILEDTKAH
jgi:hypothetical protein